MTEETDTATRRKPGRPKRPATPITETPEFKKAVADAVHEAAGGILAALQGKGEPSDNPLGDRAFAENLALSIAQLTDQGSGRKRVAPEVVKQRIESGERMKQLLIAARNEGLVPLYQLKNKVYLDEMIVDPIYIDPASKSQKATEIEWPGVPNEAMIPINAVAKGIFEAFKDSIGSIAKEHLTKELPLSVTAGGLVVKGVGKAMRPAIVGNMEAEAMPAAGEGLRIKGKGSPGQHREIRVLGTVAAPARVGG